MAKPERAEARRRRRRVATGASGESSARRLMHIYIYISRFERLAEPTRGLNEARPPSSQLARPPPHDGLERVRKTQRGRARAAQRPILSLTARPGNGEGTCWTQAGRERGVRRRRLREEERATPVPWMGVGHLDTFHLPGYAVGPS